MATDEKSTGMPRWVKITFAVVAAAVLLVVVMLLFGHRPGRHLSSHRMGYPGAAAASLAR